MTVVKILWFIIVFAGGYTTGWLISNFMHRQEREEAAEWLRKTMEFRRDAELNLGRAKRYLEDATKEHEETREMIAKFREELREAGQDEKADL